MLIKSRSHQCAMRIFLILASLLCISGHTSAAQVKPLFVGGLTSGTGTAGTATLTWKTAGDLLIEADKSKNRLRLNQNTGKITINFSKPVQLENLCLYALNSTPRKSAYTLVLSDKDGNPLDLSGSATNALFFDSKNVKLPPPSGAFLYFDKVKNILLLDTEGVNVGSENYTISLPGSIEAVSQIELSVTSELGLADFTFFLK